ncbi:hypothetical protein [Mucilaginibacter lappiensis]|uniref:Uncharacterized protein n=1 Tax=Mucilaginibacter lappiensis TaxID=354630 RepID=A0A1N7GG85_9SPHI|nr:hypothetical protein [Mucilaginibacter lappiensis]MBB6108103.1 hypothetical protein [Mucilaginibacter lappiensis]MBB6130249.1 hypothetical protein [Mucilaginibacter lappiensis]SIS11603.1 hypothetical protein SAMN05421821_12813 [Mucilaginibacter lappiensis]
MKPLIPIKYVLPLGLFLLALSMIVKSLYPSEPDAVDGLLKGFSIGILVLYLIQSLKLRKETITDKSC